MIKILIAEDMQILRGALVALLERHPDLDVVATVDNGADVLAAAMRNDVDVAVLDVEMPGKDGIAAAAELQERFPTCSSLILTSIARPGVFKRALTQRVDGFIRKDAAPEELVAAIRKVAAGQRVIDHELALAAWEVPDSPLTPRESEVLVLVAEGHDVKDIAGSLFLSKGTVRNYLTAIVTKLNARNHLDAVRLAKDAGWI